MVESWEDGLATLTELFSAKASGAKGARWLTTLKGLDAAESSIKKLGSDDGLGGRDALFDLLGMASKGIAKTGGGLTGEALYSVLASEVAEGGVW